ncbi:MAG: hypothetical protein JJD98_00350 [Polaromonas sp.]|nr:hypothetical protein [Polaromonas sp.]
MNNGMSAMQLQRAERLVRHCTALHEATRNTPLMLWLSHSFEDQADAMSVAIECAKLAASQHEYYNRRDQQRARERQGD